MGADEAQCELKEESSWFYLCRYLSLECAKCLQPLGKLLVGAPLPLSPLLDHIIVDISQVISHQPVHLNSIEAEQADCETVLAKVKELETVVETDFIESFEQVLDKFGEALTDNRKLIS